MLDFFMTGATILPYIALIGMVIKHKKDMDELKGDIDILEDKIIYVNTKIKNLERGDKKC